MTHFPADRGTLSEMVQLACRVARGEIDDGMYPDDLAADIEGDCQDVEYALAHDQWKTHRLLAFARLVHAVGHREGVQDGVMIARSVASN